MGEFVRIVWSPPTFSPLIHSSFFVLLSFCIARSRTSPLLSHFLFYMIEDTLLLFRPLFWVIEDVSFFLALRFISRRRWWLHVHVCMCASVLLDTFRRISCLFPLFGEGLHRVSRYTSGTSPRKLDFPLIAMSYYSFVTVPWYTPSFAFFCRLHPLYRFLPRSLAFE